MLLRIKCWFIGHQWKYSHHGNFYHKFERCQRCDKLRDLGWDDEYQEKSNWG